MMYEPGIHVRKPREEDLDQLADLIKRFYLFNEEFDPAWSIVPDPDNSARTLAKEYIEGSGKTLVALIDSTIVGYIHAEIRENKMLEAGKLGVITEIYVHPQARRRGIASRLVEEMQALLSEEKIRHIAAEFPAQNFVAKEFYSKLKFRPYADIYLREV
jgi:ribosomal protein S18 acetylase RimI-like enzyme